MKPKPEKCNKNTQYVPNGHRISHVHVHKILHMAIKYINIFQSMQGPLKFTEIWILGLKIYHLATLLATVFGSCMRRSGSIGLQTGWLDEFVKKSAEI
jgi:hypothetical protein